MTTKVGNPKEYAEAYKVMLAQGRSLEELNAANHLALEKKTISLQHFMAAAEVLKNECMKR